MTEKLLQFAAEGKLRNITIITCQATVINNGITGNNNIYVAGDSKGSPRTYKYENDLVEKRILSKQ